MRPTSSAAHEPEASSAGPTATATGSRSCTVRSGRTGARSSSSRSWTTPTKGRRWATRSTAEPAARLAADGELITSHRVRTVFPADWVVRVEGAPIPGGAVAVDDGRIVAVGPAAELGPGERFEGA